VAAEGMIVASLALAAVRRPPSNVKDGHMIIRIIGAGLRPKAVAFGGKAGIRPQNVRL